MRHVAAYILAVMGGNASPSEADLKSILSSVGVDAIDEHLKVVVGQLNGKDLFQLMEEGASLLAGMPMGGGAGAVSSGGSGGAAAEEAAEAPKEEAKKEESEDESDSDMGMGLFD